MIRKPMLNIRWHFVTIIAASVFINGTADAQQVGKRKYAPPAAESKVARLVTKADLQSNNSKGGGSLKADQLSVTKNCGNVQIGGTEAAADQPKPKSLIGRNKLREDNVTVVRGSAVNICR